MSKRDKYFYKKFENNLYFDGERYRVKLAFPNHLAKFQIILVIPLLV